MSTSYSEHIANALSQFFLKNQWKSAKFDETQGRFNFRAYLNSNLREILYTADLRKTDFTVYGMFPLRVDPMDKTRMAQMSEFLTRVNHCLISGNFELDFVTGDIRYKCHVDCEGAEGPTEDMIWNCIYCIAGMFDRYGDGLALYALPKLSRIMPPVDATILCEEDTPPVSQEDGWDEPDSEEDTTDPDEMFDPDENSGGMPDSSDSSLNAEEAAALRRMVQKMRTKEKMLES